MLNRFTLRAKIRHMQILVTLTEFGSMRRAATQLNMTQPAISQMVAELERLVETELFLRHARGVSLTPAGQQLLPAAQQILLAVGDASERIANEIQHKGGVARIAASPAGIGAVLHGRLKDFNLQHPETQLQIVQLRDENIMSEVIDEAYDLILMRSQTVAPEGWSFVALVPDRLCVVCGPSHPLAAGPLALADDFAASTWLMHRVGSVARNRLDTFAAQNAWPELKLCQINLHIPELTRDMLASGQYAALLPRGVLLPWIEKGELVEIASPLSEKLAPLGFMWRPEKARPAARRFALFLQKAFADIEQPDPT